MRLRLGAHQVQHTKTIENTSQEFHKPTITDIKL